MSGDWTGASEIKFVDGDVIGVSSKTMRNNHDVAIKAEHTFSIFD